MKKVKAIIFVVLTIVSLVAACAGTCFAAESSSGPDVRVNGRIVNFPDEKPFIKDGRTYIPVRFVAEALGADVSWSHEIQGAIIKKDNLELQLPIGSKTMTVMKNGEITTVTMDAAAMKQNGRTLIPIRFVAEAMGAWVSISPAYNTVQVYNDVLTPAEIDELHSFDNHWKVCDERKTLLDGKYNYENLNECCIRDFTSDISYTIKNLYNGDTYVNGVDLVEKKAQLLADYICDSFAEQYTYNGFCGTNATFRTDVSCLAATTAGTDAAYINRGYLTITFDDDADIADYKRTFNTSKFGDIKAGETYTYAIESIWMMNLASGRPSCMGKYDVTNNSYAPWR